MAEEIGIEAGAEEVIKDEDDQDQEQQSTMANQQDEEEPKSWSLVTSANDLYAVKGYIEKNLKDVQIVDYETEFVARNVAVLDDTQLESVATLCQTLEELDYVSKVYVNIQ